MSNRKFLCTVIILALIALGSSRVVPSDNEMLIAWFHMEDATVTAGNCALFYPAVDGGCTAATTEFFMQNGWTVTRISVSIGSVPWSAAEACDLDIDFAGSTTATFQVGADGLQATGDSSFTTTFVDATLAAGEIIISRHDTPVPNTYCDNGAACACSGTGSYDVAIHGVMAR